MCSVRNDLIPDWFIAEMDWAVYFSLGTVVLKQLNSKTTMAIWGVEFKTHGMGLFFDRPYPAWLLLERCCQLVKPSFNPWSSSWYWNPFTFFSCFAFCSQLHDSSNLYRDTYVPSPSCDQIAKYVWIGQLMGAMLRSREHLVCFFFF